MRAKYKICLIAFGLRLATRSTVNVAMNSWWLRSNHDLKGWVVYDGCHRGISDLLRAIVVTRNNVLVSCKVSSKDGRGKGSVRVDAWVVVVSLDCCAITCCRAIIFVFNAFIWVFRASFFSLRVLKCVCNSVVGASMVVGCCC